MPSSATPAVISASGRSHQLQKPALPRSANHWPALSGWMIAVPRFSTTQYFHVVFTLPAELAAIALAKYKAGRLRHSVPHGRRDFAHDRRRPEASWCGDRLLRRSPHVGSNLLHHPHLHVVVPGGGLSPRWQPMDLLPGWLFPAGCRFSPRLFRRLFTEALGEGVLPPVSWHFSPRLART